MHGDVQFFSSNAHRQKTLLSGDCQKRNTTECCDLHASQKDATEKHIETVNISELLDFSAFLCDPQHRGFKFNLKQFLLTVLPCWEKNAAESDKKWEDESVTVPCFVNLSDELDKLSIAESETEVTQPVGEAAVKRSKSVTEPITESWHDNSTSDDDSASNAKSTNAKSTAKCPKKTPKHPDEWDDDSTSDDNSTSDYCE